MPCEGESECQRTDTSAVHVHNEDELGGSAPVGASTRGKTAGGESGSGLEQDICQRHIGLGQGHAETGYQDERERHEDDGTGLVHQVVRYCLMLEFNMFLSLDGGYDRSYQNKKGGGLHAAGGGTRRPADEHHHNNHNDRSQSHIVHIQHHKSGGAAGDDLEKGGENLVEKGRLQTQCTISLNKEEQNCTDGDNPEGGNQDNLGLRHQALPMVFVSFFYITDTEEIADSQKSNTSEEDEYHNDDLREVAVRQAEVQQTLVNEHETSVVER